MAEITKLSVGQALEKLRGTEAPKASVGVGAFVAVAKHLNRAGDPSDFGQ